MEAATGLNLSWEIDCFVFSFFHHCESVFICDSISVIASVTIIKIAASIPAQGVVAGMKTLAALYDGATGGDERRHIASAQHRGSEGALAISLYPPRGLPMAKSSVFPNFPAPLLPGRRGSWSRIGGRG
jgi:hypothetical protein